MARARMRGGMHREEGMPYNSRRNRNRGRDAGKGTEERNGGDAGRAFCCNFDLLPHKWGPLRTYCRILRGIYATAGVFSSSLTTLGLNVPIGRFYASISAPYAHLIHKISFYWTKIHPNACICAIFVVILYPIFVHLWRNNRQ